MRYEIDTLQYREHRDTYKHNDLESLLNDLANIETLKSVEIIEIRENGKAISGTKAKVLRSLALK